MHEEAIKRACEMLQGKDKGSFVHVVDGKPLFATVLGSNGNVYLAGNDRGKHAEHLLATPAMTVLDDKGLVAWHTKGVGIDNVQLGLVVKNAPAKSANPFTGTVAAVNPFTGSKAEALPVAAKSNAGGKVFTLSQIRKAAKEYGASVGEFIASVEKQGHMVDYDK